MFGSITVIQAVAGLNQWFVTLIQPVSCALTQYEGWFGRYAGGVVERCAHDDPDNSGQCVKCGYILDVVDDRDRALNEEHPQHQFED